MAPIEASTHAARSAFCWLGVTPGLTRTVGPLALHPARMLTTKSPGMIPLRDLRMGRSPFLDDGRAERRRHRQGEAADDDYCETVITTHQQHQRALVGEETLQERAEAERGQ